MTWRGLPSTLRTNFWTGVANQLFIAVIGALALNLLTGTTGQISLGQAGFVAADGGGADHAF